MNFRTTENKPVRRPKGGVLEPFVEAILIMHRQGKSVQAITTWLSVEPRSVTISRTAVHEWIKRRIDKLQKRAAAMGPEIGIPRQPYDANELSTNRHVAERRFDDRTTCVATPVAEPVRVPMPEAEFDRGTLAVLPPPEFAPTHGIEYHCPMDISHRLREAMQAAGFKTENALAIASGVPQPTVNRILNGAGKSGPESTTVRKLSTACRVSFEWLNEGVGSRTIALPVPGTGEDARRAASKPANTERLEILELMMDLPPHDIEEIAQLIRDRHARNLAVFEHMSKRLPSNPS